MNDENKQRGIELISKYLAGEATPEEAMELHASLGDKENKEEYDKVVQLWKQLPSSVNTDDVPDAREEWRKLNERIKPDAKAKIRRLPFSRFAIAASIIGLILIISYGLFTADKKEQVAKNKEKIDVIKTATVEIISDTLPDGSVIILNKHSSVAYSSNFNKNNRETELKGEAFFNVVPDKTRPFIIAIDEVRIKVVGTSFNVRSIPSNGNIEVQVQSGIVKMYTTEKEITVTKGQTGIYSKEGGDLELKDILDINSMSYATKTFSFNDLSLVDACRYLEKTFNVIINIDAQKFAECRLTANFNNKPLDYILDIISATLNSSYKKQGNTIYIIGEGCK